MFKSIRHSLFAALAGFTVLLCVTYTGLALVISYVTEDMLVDRLLQREAAAIISHYRATGELRAPGNDLIRLYDGSGTLPAIVRPYAAAGRERAEIATNTGQHYHLRTVDLDGPAGKRRLYLLADAGPVLVVSKLFQDVGGFLFSVAFGLIALALLLAYGLSRKLVNPLQVLTNEVRRLTPGAPVTFSAHDRRDEIGYLADKLGTTIVELNAALHREHAFTRDVSHELRTPLTVMNNALAQAAARPLERHEVAQVQAGLDDIRKTIDVLFALARAEHIARETFDLRGYIEQGLLDAGDWHDDRLTMRLPDRLHVTGNPQLAALLVNNCVRNAVFHGGPHCRLRVTFAEGVLTLANSIDATRPAATQGFLHGQNLLRRIAAAMDWRIGFHGEAAGYRVDIVPLPPR